MKYAILFSLTIGLFSCVKTIDFKISPNQNSCDSLNRTIRVQTVDFYSGEVIPNIKLQIYAQPLLSVYGFEFVKEFTTDTNSLAITSFENNDNTSYNVTVLPNSDTSYIYPWRLQVQSDCVTNWLVKMKPVQTLNLTVKNNSLTAFGKHYLYIARVDSDNAHSYLNDNIWEMMDYTFGYVNIDTIPIGFEKNYVFKVVPEERLEIGYGWSNSKKKEIIFTDKVTVSSYTLSL
jgi:hypothetical protein